MERHQPRDIQINVTSTVVTVNIASIVDRQAPVPQPSQGIQIVVMKDSADAFSVIVLTQDD